MARQINTIIQEIIAEKEAQPQLSALSSSSSTAIWRLWVYVVAVAIYSVEIMFDFLRDEIFAVVDAKTPGTLTWYRNQALNYRHGSHLVFDSNGWPSYPDNDSSPKIISQCSVREVSNGLLIKIAKKTNELMPLDSDELAGFSEYISLVKYAGTPIRIVNGGAVQLSVSIEIQYDVLLLESDGKEIITGNYPVIDTINAFLENLPFDGRLSKNALIDYIIKNAPGVKDLVILYLGWRSIDTESYQSIESSHVPSTGYFKITDLNVTYVNYV